MDIMTFAQSPQFVWYLLALILWTYPWKAWALWLASRRGELKWFLALLLLNTFAILEIFYIFIIAKQKDSKE